LALYLLADPERWTRATLEEAINSGKSSGLVLTKPMPIFFTYWTAWVDQAGVLQLRPDVYHRDRRLLRLWGKTAT
jgi:murein L,D-transpeptidase YcbB/YkuD